MSRSLRVCVALAVATIGSIVQGFRLPLLLGGANLSIVTGRLADHHLLTIPLQHVIRVTCGVNARCVQSGNLIAFAVVVAIFVLIASRRGSLLTMTIGALIFALSPLSQAAVLDPLGAGASAMLALLLLAIADIAGILTLPVWARCILAAALVLQDPLLTSAALFYPLVTSRKWHLTALPAGFALIALAIQIGHDRSMIPGLLHPTIDSLAGPVTVFVLGCGFFAAAPLQVLLRKRRAFAALPSPVGNMLPVIAFGVLALSAGLFSSSGDPSSYWLALEAAIVLPLASAEVTATRSFRLLTIILSCIFVAQIGILALYRRNIPTRVVARQSEALLEGLKQPEASCIVSDPSGRHHILSDGDFAKLYAPRTKAVFVDDALDCLNGLSPSAQVLTVRGIYVHAWGASIPLLQASVFASHASFVLPTDQGRVFPKAPAHTPTRLGGFANGVQTPLGALADFTLLSGYYYTFSCVSVPGNARLAFAVTTIPGTGPLLFDVSSGSGTQQRQVVRGRILRVNRGALDTWQFFSAAITKGDCVAITFHVASPDGTLGKWMTFAGAAVR